jgi:hypothetical protein
MLYQQPFPTTTGSEEGTGDTPELPTSERELANCTTGPIILQIAAMSITLN